MATSLAMSTPTKVNGIPTGWQADLLAILGGPIQRRLAQWGKVV